MFDDFDVSYYITVLVSLLMGYWGFVIRESGFEFIVGIAVLAPVVHAIRYKMGAFVVREFGSEMGGMVKQGASKVFTFAVVVLFVYLSFV